MKLIIEELQNIRIAAEDMVELQLKVKISTLENEISNLQNLPGKLKAIWDKKEVDKTDVAIVEKQQRIGAVRNRLERKSKVDQMKFKQSAQVKAIQLAEENRLKRRSLGGRAKRKLDSEAEDFIVQCIEEKGEAQRR